MSHLGQAPLAKVGIKLKFIFYKSKMYKVTKESLERVATLNLKWRKLLLLLCLVASTAPQIFLHLPLFNGGRTVTSFPLTACKCAFIPFQF